MNLIPMIVKELGVEVGEEFKLRWNGVEQTGIFRFTNYRLESKFRDEEDWDECSVLANLLNGEITIVKIPFEPKSGEEFYKVCVSGGKLTACVEIWADYLVDYALKYCGNCFRSKAEAEKHKFEIYEKLTGRKWEEK